MSRKEGADLHRHRRECESGNDLKLFLLGQTTNWKPQEQPGTNIQVGKRGKRIVGTEPGHRQCEKQKHKPLRHKHLRLGHPGSNVILPNGLPLKLGRLRYDLSDDGF